MKTIISVLLLCWSSFAFSSEPLTAEAIDQLASSESTSEGGHAISPPKEYFSVATISFRNRYLVQVGQDLINQNVVVMPSPNLIKTEKLPGQKRRLTFQQYFPDSESHILTHFNIIPKQLHYLYINSYKVFDQSGNLLDQIQVPAGALVRAPQYYSLDVDEKVKSLSFVFGFSARTAWVDSGITSDLHSIFKKLQNVEVDRDAKLFLKVNAESGVETWEAFTSEESQKIDEILHEIQFTLVWGTMAGKEAILDKLLALQDFKSVNVDFNNAVESMRRYPQLFKDPDSPETKNIIKHIKSHKLTESEYTSEKSNSTKLGLDKVFSFGNDNSSKATTRLKKMVEFEFDGQFYVPRALNVSLRANNSLTQAKEVVFHVVNNFKEADYLLGSVVSLVDEAKPTEIKVINPILSGSVNVLRQDVKFECGKNSVMTGTQSDHSLFADRTFRYQCHDILVSDQPVQKKDCSASGGTALRQSFSFSCEGGKVLSGESSHFDKIDRTFSWNCCAIEDEYRTELVPNQCTWSAWANAIRSPVRFSCPQDQVLAGVKSEWSPHFRDRTYSYLCCSLKNRAD